MKMADIVKVLGFEIKVIGDLTKDVTGCYVSDILSDVLANGKEGNLWITLQTHENIIGVAHIKELPGIIITGGRVIRDEIIEKAMAENLTIITSSLPTFKVAGAVYNLFLQGQI